MKAHGIATFGNRPLTIRQNGKTYKLVKYSHPVDEDDVLSAMNARLKNNSLKKNLSTELTDVYIIKYLYLRWKTLDSDTFFSDLYELYFMKYVREIFDNSIPPSALNVFRNFENQLRMYIQNRMYVESEEFFKEKGF